MMEPQEISKMVEDLLKIVGRLESQFPDRKFSLDGHLLGSIGEVMASYYYGVELYKLSSPQHDGSVLVGGQKKEVQIKIVTQDNIQISSEPEYLIVLYLNKENRTFYEVYNGPGKFIWSLASAADRHGYRHLRVNKLIEKNPSVTCNEKIPVKNHIDKMKAENKNKNKLKL